LSVFPRTRRERATANRREPCENAVLPEAVRRQPTRIAAHVQENATKQRRCSAHAAGKDGLRRPSNASSTCAKPEWRADGQQTSKPRCSRSEAWPDMTTANVAVEFSPPPQTAKGMVSGYAQYSPAFESAFERRCRARRGRYRGLVDRRRAKMSAENHALPRMLPAGWSRPAAEVVASRRCWLRVTNEQMSLYCALRAAVVHRNRRCTLNHARVLKVRKER